MGLITGLPDLPLPIVAGDYAYVDRGSVDYIIDLTDIPAGVQANLDAYILTNDAAIAALQTGTLSLSGGTMLGALVLAADPTAALQPATKQYVDNGLTAYATLASPALTGTPTAPTATAGDSSTALATTAFIQGEIAYLSNRTVVAAAVKNLVESETGIVDVTYTTTGICTITLPEISTLTNASEVFYKIKDIGFNAGTNNIVINRGGADSIENGATSISITTNGEDISVYNDGGSSWYISNVDTDASTSSKGVVLIADSATTKALVSTDTVVTPSGLSEVLVDTVYKSQELGTTSKTFVEADSGLWYVTYTNTGSVSLTLPDPTSLVNASAVVFEITDVGNAGTNNITITTAGGQINSSNIFTISTTRAGAKFINDGTNWFSTADTSTAVTSAVQKSPTVGLTTLEIELGDWDMDTTTSITVPHGLSATEYKSIRSIDVIIRDDADVLYRPIDGAANLGVGQAGAIGDVDATNINLTRGVGREFDSVNYSTTSYNRGWLTLQYTKD